MAPKLPLGYLCHPSYNCNCGKWRLLSFRNAMRHRDLAQKRLNKSINRCFVPLPRAIRTEDQLPGFQPFVSTEQETSTSSSEPDNISLNSSRSISDIYSSSSQGFGLSSDTSDGVDESSAPVSPPSNETIDFDVSPHLEFTDLRFSAFWNKHKDLLGLAASRDHNGAAYVDFFSGSVFKEVVQGLGGEAKAKQDMFLTLSADGVNPFKSSEYTYWPVIATVLNLSPSERFKASNLLPLIIIPGPNEPKDLTSFLQPFIEEILSLSEKGRVVQLWDGRLITVRVHLLFVLGDLLAMKKLTHLKGPNGLVPCRFCSIRGGFRHHSYFPSAVMDEMVEEDSCGRRKKRKTVKRVWDVNDLPIRTEESVQNAYSQINDFSMDGSSRAVQKMLKDEGFSSLKPSPLLEISTIIPFRSFPPDIMHLFFQNLAKPMVNIWTDLAPENGDIAFLTGLPYVAVEKTLLRCGSGIASNICRRPRGLDLKGKWKANEWKVFILKTSLVALHGWVPEKVLDGWHLFVVLTELFCQWELSVENVEDVEDLAKAFFLHYEETYYRLKPERIRLCKYVFHLLLHISNSIKQCGPISLLGQWSKENFVGQTNRNSQAKFLFAESIREHLKYEAAAQTYGILSGLPAKYIDGDLGGPEISDSLRSTSDMENLDGYEMRHPSQMTTILEEQATRFPRISVLVQNFYMTALGISKTESGALLRRNKSITKWDCLCDAKTTTLSEMVHRKYKEDFADKNTRAACFFAGIFQGHDPHTIDVSYGRAISFIEHCVDGEKMFLVLADWVTRGLCLGRQGQVFARKKRQHNSLFSSRTIESVECMSHPIEVIESEVKNGRGRFSNRTYFVDAMQEPHGTLSGKPWKTGAPRMKLRGIEK